MERADGHRYFEGLAVAHVLGGLDDSEGRVFRSHLLECGSCRARVGELRAIAHDLADVERDERRVRAAQAIETKSRETDEEPEEAVEPPPSARASRMTVIVGLVLIIGLSLWNFTLRGALTVHESRNRNLVSAGVISEAGTPWTEVFEMDGVEGSVKHRGDRFVVALDGLDGEQVYGLYVETDEGVAASHIFKPAEGRLYQLFKLPEKATRITVTDPEDTGDDPARPGPHPDGEKVLEAVRP